jgi:hypothetical protein
LQGSIGVPDVRVQGRQRLLVDSDGLQHVQLAGVCPRDRRTRTSRTHLYHAARVADRCTR